MTEDAPVSNLEGQLLIATPMVRDSCFERAVVYLCAHNTQGAMGMIINQVFDNLHQKEVFERLSIDIETEANGLPIHFGGPVEPARGFVLHSTDYTSEETLVMEADIAITSNIEVLRDIAHGRGPSCSMLLLGYAGWAPGQLESELEENAWMTIPATTELIFNTPPQDVWRTAAASLGITDISMLSGDVGHA